MKNQFTNTLQVPEKMFIPMGQKMVRATEMKWTKKYVHPEFARFKAQVYWANSEKSSPFFSFEGAKNMTEEKGYEDLMRRVVKGKNPNTYISIMLYMNVTNDLRTSQKNYNYEITCYMAGQPARMERKIIFDPAGRVNIQATIEVNK